MMIYVDTWLQSRQYLWDRICCTNDVHFLWLHDRLFTMVP